MAGDQKKIYSGKKVSVHEEFLKDIKAHNRSLVDEKNNLINKLTQAEDKILQLNSKIEELQKENSKLKKDLELKSEKQEEIQVNFTHEEDLEPISEPQYEPKSKVFEEVKNTLQNKPNIANNIQTEPFNPYRRVYLTPLENSIIEELLKEPQTYNQLSTITGVKPENLRTHKKNLKLKGILIEDRKIPGTNNKILYINEDQFKRTKIQIKTT